VISPETVDAMLARLGFSSAPAPDLNGLRRVYAAWCQTVPFDNILKRIHLVGGAPTQFPNAVAQPFFDAFLAHGTGGTCWPSSLALFALLDALGFDVRLGSAAMGDAHSGPIHTHGTLILRCEGAQYWVDSSMLTDVPVALVAGSPTLVAHPLRPVRAEPVGELWRVWWRPPGMADDLGCLLLDDDVTVEHYFARYEASRNLGRFNTQLYATRNQPDSVLTVLSGQRIVLDAAGSRSSALGWSAVDSSGRVSERTRVLIEEFGYSEEIVSRLPADDLEPVP
jgi:N-hydroxyarylamine O-acetyltransferase